MRRRAAGALRARTRNQRLHTRAVEVWKLRRERIECARFREQTLAPAFEGMLPCRVDAVTLRPQVEASSNRSRILIAHQLADELQLPFAPAPGGDSARRDNRVDEALGQSDIGGELGEAFGIECDERLAQILQRMH